MDYSLVQAIKFGHIQIVKNHDIESLNNSRGLSGESYLHLGVASGNEAIVRYLIKILGDVDLMTIKDHEELTPLHWACLEGKHLALGAILEHSKRIGRLEAILNSRDVSGESPLYLCCLNGFYNGAKILLEQPSIDINIQSNNGNTPLHIAVINGHMNCIELLIQRGSLYNIKNNNNQTSKELWLKSSLSNNNSYLFYSKNDDKKNDFLNFNTHYKNNYNHDDTIINADSGNDNDYYIGAVLEYSPRIYNYRDPNETPLAYVLGNVKEYDEYARQAASQGAQIIVFPEYGLLGGAFATRDGVFPYLEIIPDPSESSSPIIPCNGDEFLNRTILQALSCIAIKNKIVMVVDMGDLQYCNNETDSNCPSDGRFQYNTQVAFSQKGEILAKYHKSHLYGESYFNPSIPPKPVVFTTDFNVTFGMLICFDILFQEPQQQLIQNYSIKNLVYSTEWVNVNYAYAREIQQSWSKLNNANVLAANIGSTSLVSGSGIYSNGNFLSSFLNPTTKPENKLLVSRIPKDPSIQAPSVNRKESGVPKDPSIQASSVNYKESNYQAFKHESFGSSVETPTSINATIVPFTIEPNQVNQSITSINNNFTCNFIYSTSSNVESGQLYSLISFSGFFNGFFYAQLCSASRCGSNDPESCFDNVFESQSIFENASIDGNFYDDYRIYPTVTTYPLTENYLKNYNLGDYSLNISDIKEYFVGMSLFAIQ
ncbi:hypothetical protein DICPUDRAFT_150765 [Dictyostelium purpureum]|uniref:CN hydrolase domain-containing protein n=1 Tax=Dictyostelium purpureum TaxID=5786 RepID=F0ZH71_DICPU|nr:uncharacterized protein DICPUDRAFT_150765 [Dictyostelium purpureum]EGC36744.1 hypothetical protein DICPUDRAFT_150765 [Dictyostelium purpureum]|eukprot:XP_003286769.1 hypothetical protein DICPUDRAFT_150765 [Dictyostelium purpureum]